MPECGFEDEFSSGSKMLLIGGIVGALLWLTMGEKKHGTKGYDVKPPPPKPPPAAKQESK
jgi:hypothetical protein